MQTDKLNREDFTYTYSHREHNVYYKGVWITGARVIAERKRYSASNAKLHKEQAELEIQRILKGISAQWVYDNIAKINAQCANDINPS